MTDKPLIPGMIPVSNSKEALELAQRIWQNAKTDPRYRTPIANPSRHLIIRNLECCTVDEKFGHKAFGSAMVYELDEKVALMPVEQLHKLVDETAPNDAGSARYAYYGRALYQQFVQQVSQFNIVPILLIPELCLSPFGPRPYAEQNDNVLDTAGNIAFFRDPASLYLVRHDTIGLVSMMKEKSIDSALHELFHEKKTTD